MKKIFLFLILFLTLAFVAQAVPVTYKGALIYNVTNTTNNFTSSSTTSTYNNSINQTANTTNFMINHIENENVIVDFYFYGDGMIYKRYEQPLPGTLVNIGNVYISEPDTDMDGIPDSLDPCDYAIGIVCVGDLDGDNVPDANDSLTGDEYLIETNVPSINMTVNSSTNTSQSFKGELIVEFLSGSNPIVEMCYNFSKGNITTANITIIKQTTADGYGKILVHGLESNCAVSTTKILYLNRILGEDYVCVLDSAITSISQLPSQTCSGASETPVPCSASGSSASGYTCKIIGSYFQVQGLSNSGIVESTYTPPTPATPPSSGGGGGSGFAPLNYSNATTTTTSIIVATTTTTEVDAGEATTTSQTVTTSVETTTTQDVGGIGAITGAFTGTLGKVKPWTWWLILIVAILVGVILFIAKYGGIPGDDYFTRAAKIHQQAQNAHRSGNLKKSEKLYKKAQELREMGESQL